MTKKEYTLAHKWIRYRGRSGQQRGSINVDPVKAAEVSLKFDFIIDTQKDPLDTPVNRIKNLAQGFGRLFLMPQKRELLTRFNTMM
jgi:hypothetical protein